jgi:hypothetical protein
MSETVAATRELAGSARTGRDRLASAEFASRPSRRPRRTRGPRRGRTTLAALMIDVARAARVRRPTMAGR